MKCDLYIEFNIINNVGKKGPVRILKRRCPGGLEFSRHLTNIFLTETTIAKIVAVTVDEITAT